VKKLNEVGIVPSKDLHSITTKQFKEVPARDPNDSPKRMGSIAATSRNLPKQGSTTSLGKQDSAGAKHS
jgi:hypothetical protein